MNTFSIPKKSVLFFAFIIMLSSAFGQSTWTEKSAAKWVKQGEWKNGMKLNVDESVNKVVFAEQYHKNRAVWDKAFAFLRDSDLNKLKPGKYAIDVTNAYATITEAASKEFDKSAWESHRNYIDLQYVIKGEEKIGVAPVATTTATKPY